MVWFKVVTRSTRAVAVPHHVVPPLIRYLRSRGADADGLLERFRLSCDVEAASHALVTIEQFGAMLERAAELVGDPFLALRLPGELEFTRYNFAELAASTSATFRDAWARMVRYAALVNQHVVFAFEERGDEAIWTQRTVGHPRGIGRAAGEYALASVLFHARRQLQRAVLPGRVWFQHARPPDVEPLVQFFGTGDIEFEREDNGITFERSLLDKPLPGFDPRLLATAEALASSRLLEQPRDLLARVRSAIGEQFGTGTAPSAPATAARLRLSERSLQRRLAQEGTTFSKLLDGSRSETARELGREGKLSVSEIAWQLGFSEVATFGRAFRRWTGESPAAYRNRHAARF